MEMLDLIDEQGNLTGQTAERKLVHKNGLLHHASGLIILNKVQDQWYMLSQQRSKNKEKNAGLWDMSASGHIPSGETPIQSLDREVEEELGIKLDINKFKLLGTFWRHEVHNGNFYENELGYIYICFQDINISLITVQKTEVEQVQWLSIQEFKNLLNNSLAVKRKYVWNSLFDFIEKLP